MNKVIKSICGWYLNNTEKQLSQDKAIQQEEKRTHDALKASLTEKQSQLLAEFILASWGVSSDEVDEAFVRGFKIGALLMCEIHDFDPEA